MSWTHNIHRGLFTAYTFLNNSTEMDRECSVVKETKLVREFVVSCAVRPVSSVKRRLKTPINNTFSRFRTAWPAREMVGHSDINCLCDQRSPCLQTATSTSTSTLLGRQDKSLPLRYGIEGLLGNGQWAAYFNFTLLTSSALIHVMICLV